MRPLSQMCPVTEIVLQVPSGAILVCSGTFPHSVSQCCNAGFASPFGGAIAAHWESLRCVSVHLGRFVDISSNILFLSSLLFVQIVTSEIFFDISTSHHFLVCQKNCEVGFRTR